MNHYESTLKSLRIITQFITQFITRFITRFITQFITQTIESDLRGSVMAHITQINSSITQRALWWWQILMLYKQPPYVNNKYWFFVMSWLRASLWQLPQCSHISWGQALEGSGRGIRVHSQLPVSGLPLASHHHSSKSCARPGSESVSDLARGSGVQLPFGHCC